MNRIMYKGFLPRITRGNSNIIIRNVEYANFSIELADERNTVYLPGIFIKIKIPRCIRSFTVKEDHIGSAFS